MAAHTAGRSRLSEPVRSRHDASSTGSTAPSVVGTSSASSVADPRIVGTAR
ncbi:hypothetical protein [Streptomyces sp. MA15]|uniref:hypothetical protein n=1 Tax=Streptomyces sp. MA15 TaxID=3055061 RepID=UPI0025B04AE5|nr:hypothetical protein [Streptomyces sp. MA15]MDN3270208.1 hypothetical protein [Streptomyces sp. MA15]